MHPKVRYASKKTKTRSQPWKELFLTAQVSPMGHKGGDFTISCFSAFIFRVLSEFHMSISFICFCFVFTPIRYGIWNHLNSLKEDHFSKHKCWAHALLLIKLFELMLVNLFLIQAMEKDNPFVILTAF